MGLSAGFASHPIIKGRSCVFMIAPTRLIMSLSLVLIKLLALRWCAVLSPLKSLILAADQLIGADTHSVHYKWARSYCIHLSGEVSWCWAKSKLFQWDSEVRNMWIPHEKNNFTPNNVVCLMEHFTFLYFPFIMFNPWDAIQKIERDYTLFCTKKTPKNKNYKYHILLCGQYIS